MTNYERITESEEALANFLMTHMNCIDCPMQKPCLTAFGCKSLLIEWLKQESE